MSYTRSPFSTLRSLPGQHHMFPVTLRVCFHLLCRFYKAQLDGSQNTCLTCRGVPLLHSSGIGNPQQGRASSSLLAPSHYLLVLAAHTDYLLPANKLHQIQADRIPLILPKIPPSLLHIASHLQLICYWTPSNISLWDVWRLTLCLGPKLGHSLYLPSQILASGICSALIEENIAHNLYQ